ncbi:MAG: hypothetical protein C0399_00180 [Syntrophus sp. (in: bacteria)]|nr:hypothetical protein [Syntrophus sp. (in: bacteria)]
MSETHEVNLIRNVQAPVSQSSVSKEFVGLKRKQRKENKKRSDGYNQDHPPPSQGHVGYEREPVAHDEQDSTIDITI